MTTSRRRRRMIFSSLYGHSFQCSTEPQYYLEIFLLCYHKCETSKFFTHGNPAHNNIKRKYLYTRANQLYLFQLLRYSYSFTGWKVLPETKKKKIGVDKVRSSKFQRPSRRSRLCHSRWNLIHALWRQLTWGASNTPFNLDDRGTPCSGSKHRCYHFDFDICHF